MFAVSKGNVAWPEAGHGVPGFQSLRPVILLARAGETERVEVFCPWVDLLICVHFPGCHGNESALWNESSVGEGEVLHSNAENEGCAMR